MVNSDLCLSQVRIRIWFSLNQVSAPCLNYIFIYKQFLVPVQSQESEGCELHMDSIPYIFLYVEGKWII